MIHTRLPELLRATLLDMVEGVMATRPPDQELGHPDHSTYLQRWVIEGGREGRAHAHRTLRSDFDHEMHDHPWDNVSIILDGEIHEEIRTGAGDRMLVLRRPGDVISRLAGEQHRLLVDRPATTLFLVGPKNRDWGFQGDDGIWIHNETLFAQRGYS